MQTKEFFFDLPQELIAQNPSEKRGEDRLLFSGRRKGTTCGYLLYSLFKYKKKKSTENINGISRNGNK